MTVAIAAAALRWLLAGTPHVVAGPWHDAHEGRALVMREGDVLRVVDVREWCAGDGWLYARGEDGAVWVVEERMREAG